VTRYGSARTWALVLPLLLASLANRSAAGQDEAPRRPPEPFRVFVQTSDPAEPALKAALEEALPVVQERVERRRHWFRVVESPEKADISVRLVNYRTGPSTGFPNVAESPPGTSGFLAREYHFLDAVVRSGESWGDLSGLTEGRVRQRPEVRKAADHLARELERFCKENYAALMRFRLKTRPDTR